MSTLFLIVGVVMMSAAIVLLFLDTEPPLIAAYFGLWLLSKSGYVPVPYGQLIFWAIVVLLMIVLRMMKQSKPTKGVAGHSYRTVGALAGMACGLAFGYAGVIVGSLLGMIIGGVAYAMTPAGGRRFDVAAMRLTVADGFPAAITFCMVGIALASLIAYSHPF